MRTNICRQTTEPAKVPNLHTVFSVHLAICLRKELIKKPEQSLRPTYLFALGPLEGLGEERGRGLGDVAAALAQLGDALFPREAELHEVGDVLLHEVV